MFLKSLCNSPKKGLQKYCKGLRKRSRLKAPSSPMWKRGLVDSSKKFWNERWNSTTSVSRQLGKGRTQEAKRLIALVRELGPEPVKGTSSWFLEEMRILSGLVLVSAQIFLRTALWPLSIYFNEYWIQTTARHGGGGCVAKANLGLKDSFLDEDFVFCKLKQGRGASAPFSMEEELILLSKVKKLIRIQLPLSRVIVITVMDFLLLPTFT